ncbi:metallophosphoesterase MPPED2-like [Mya arenaria]|uniref:metallophosphoesterase MPPED2-like n=1 Tax=Mya arenaria TaxID=6604 RepID=UPI0022E5C887|nr:metallophosphoesterase MPPED2-like [Mya arenaria]
MLPYFKEVLSSYTETLQLLWEVDEAGSNCTVVRADNCDFCMASSDPFFKINDFTVGNPSSKGISTKERQNRNLEETVLPSPNVIFAKPQIKFVCISDTHMRLYPKDVLNIPLGDVLLHAGDFSMKGNLPEIEYFNQLLGQFPHPVKVVIAGNHESCLDSTRRRIKKPVSMQHMLKTFGVEHPRDLLTNCIYLQEESVIVSGIKIYGAPWSPLYCSTAFQLDRGQPLAEKWDKIPDNVDILMTHCPPYGICDTYGEHPDQHAGCEELLNVLQTRISPKVHVFGHIHEGYGETKKGGVHFINASMCTRGYRPINPAIVFELDNPLYQPDHSSNESEGSN